MNTAPLSIALAEKTDRVKIFRLRHDVYASELQQHACNASQSLHDPLDDHNIYIVARSGHQLPGFISITPPHVDRFSIEKYVHKRDLPLPRDDATFEIRLLTVAQTHRCGSLALMLMYAAARYVEDQGGRAIIGMGRCELLPLYQRVGFRLNGRTIISGHAQFELMSAFVADVRRACREHPHILQRLRRQFTWALDFPFENSTQCYHGGAFFESIGEDFSDLDRRKRIINADVLDAWFPPAPQVIKAVWDHASWLMRTSPPTHCAGLLNTIASVRKIPTQCIVPGAGSSDLIFRSLRHWLSSNSRVLLLDPTYGEYAHVLERIIGCNVDRYTLHWEQDFRVDAARLLQRTRAARFDLVVLVNPNSPTGQHLHRDQMQWLLQHIPRRTRIWIDETYVDYAGADQSLERFACDSTNVVICKSMSKVYALSGMRVAYLCGPRELIDPLREITPPWVIGLPAQVAAVHALKASKYYEARYRQTHRLRDDFATALERFGFNVVPSTINSLLCRLPIDGPNSSEFVKSCRAQDLFVRDASCMGTTLGERAVRIAVKDRATNQRMLEIIRAILQCEQAHDQNGSMQAHSLGVQV